MKKVIGLIIKAVKAVFMPNDFDVQHNHQKNYYVITFYFDEIDEKYGQEFFISEPKTPEELESHKTFKKLVLKDEIHIFVRKWLDIKVFLKPLNFYYSDNTIYIDVQYSEQKN